MNKSQIIKEWAAKNHVPVILIPEAERPSYCQLVGLKLTYAITELSDDARERAINNHRDWNVDHRDWYESVVEGAKELADYLGIEINNVYFSGFWSQGDGACFTGNFHLDGLDLCRMRKDHNVPVGPMRQYLQELENMLMPLQALREAMGPFVDKAHDEGACIIPNVCIRHTGRYSHEYSMDLTFNHDTFDDAFGDMDEVDYALLEAAYREALRPVTHGSNPDADIDEMVTEALRDFARWIYRQLQEEYEYLTSDEQVMEALDANDMRFTEDGDDA